MYKNPRSYLSFCFNTEGKRDGKYEEKIRKEFKSKLFVCSFQFDCEDRSSGSVLKARHYFRRQTINKCTTLHDKAKLLRNSPPLLFRQETTFISLCEL